MSKFKVGDKITVNSYCSSCEPGEEYIVYYDESDKCLFARNNDLRKSGYSGCSCENKWEKLRSTMSKYDELKGRIEGAENGWDSDVDDLLEEILPHLPKRCSPTIQVYMNQCAPSTGGIHIILNGEKSYPFLFNSQCEKMDAFRKALLHMLDHSDIKKSLEGTTQKVKIDGKVYEAEIIKEVC